MTPSDQYDPYLYVQQLMQDESLTVGPVDQRLEALSKYPKTQQDVFLVLLSEGLIGNGGTPGLFCNDGCMAPAVAKAYQSIGAHGHAEWVLRLIEQIGLPYPSDIEVLNTMLERIPDELWDESTFFFFDQRNFKNVNSLIEHHCRN